MFLHNLFGRHAPNLEAQRWESGYFVAECALCGRVLIKLPGLPWRLRPSAA